MDKKIRIRFIKDAKGNYHYQAVDVVDSLDSIKDSNIVVLKDDKYASILKFKTTRLLMDHMENKDEISIVLSDSLVDKLIKQCEKKGYKDYQVVIKELLEHLMSKLNGIEIEEHGGIGSVTLKYPEKKVINGSEKTEGSGQEEQPYEIDMSKINPKEVVERIKKKVVAQDPTVESIVYNIYNNQRIFDTKDDDLISASKSSILMDGPTGTGKTLIVKQVAKELSLPLITRSATMYSAAGYEGHDLEEMLVGLLEVTGGNLEAAERGVIILDEFDKLGGRGDNKLEMKKAVQQELLTFLSGGKFPVEYNGQTYDFDTSRITFICLGAFQDLRERKIKEGLDENGQYEMNPDDYIGEGIMRELVGRFSLITATKSLTKQDLMDILMKSEISPLTQLQNLGRQIYQKDILINEDMVEKIAEEALQFDTGARALATIVNGIREQVLDALINGQETQIVIDEELLQRVRDARKRGVAK